MIEGEDFSHVVWGLGANASSNEPSVASDHIKSSTPGEKRDINTIKRLTDSYSSGPNPAVQRPLRREPISHSPLIYNPTQTLIGRRPSESKNSEPYSSLGLSFSEPPHHSNSHLHQQKDPFFLHTSPALRDRNLSQLTSPHIFIDSRENPGRTSQVIIPSGPRMSALDIAQQYRLKQQSEKVLLTPPDSTKSELWSPHLSQLDLRDFATLDSCYFDTLRYSGNGAYRDSESQSRLDSHHAPQPLPVSDYYTDQSQELRDFVYNQITSSQPRNISRFVPPHGRQAYDDLEQLSPPPDMSPYIDSSLLSDQFHDIRTAQPHSSRPSPRISQSIPQAYIPPSPTSPDLHKSSTGTIPRQPRSIPFARLLQRRLSAVPEEDESKQLSSAGRECRSRSSLMMDRGQQVGDKGMTASSRYQDFQYLKSPPSQIQRSELQNANNENGLVTRKPWSRSQRSDR